MSWPSSCLVAAELTQLRMQATFKDESGGPDRDSSQIHASLQHDWTLWVRCDFVFSLAEQCSRARPASTAAHLLLCLLGRLLPALYIVQRTLQLHSLSVLATDLLLPVNTEFSLSLITLSK